MQKKGEKMRGVVSKKGERDDGEKEEGDESFAHEKREDWAAEVTSTV